MVWNVGVVERPIADFLGPTGEFDVQWFPPPPPGTWLADPFAVQYGGSLHVLCEEFNITKRRGRIVAVQVKDGSVSPPSVAIEEPFHLSYPYLVRHDGEIYCIPDSWQKGEIAIYKALKFPTRWERVCSLCNFTGIDNTVFNHEERWWLASTDGGPYNRLFLWYSDSLLGPWSPHPLNPVKSDKRSSRPAGTPFTHNGQLFRPSQDCSGTYGKRIIINRVEKLTPTQFSEHEVSTVEPFKKSPYPKGVHTLCGVENRVFLDGQQLVYAKSALRENLMYRGRKLIAPPDK